MGYKVLLGVPHNGHVCWDSGQSAWCCSAEHSVQVCSLPTSLLALGFNTLWCEALNRNERDEEITHFAMLHSDINAGQNWIDTLMRVLDDKEADLVSAVNAIKDDRGLTSTGVGLRGVNWRPWRRFTMKFLETIPRTFNAAEAGFPDKVLLHNTGCWVADLRRPLFHQANPEGELIASFTIRDRIVRRNGTWRPEVEPEDWYFSRRLDDLGANTYATRELVTNHFGLSSIGNQGDWGTREDDDDLINEWAEVFAEAIQC